MSSKQSSVFGALELTGVTRRDAHLSFRTCYIAIPLYICGFVVLGAAIQKHLTIGALVMGWGIAEVAVMINTVAVCKFWTQ